MLADNRDPLNRLREQDPSIDALIAYIERWVHRQDLQSWLQMVLSLLLGWVMGQINLHLLLPHLF